MVHTRPAKLLSIYINHGDKWHHEPLHLALLDRARRAGLAGVTLFHAEGGVGSHHLPHTEMNEISMAHMPVVVQIVDTDEAITAFLPAVLEMVPTGLVTLSAVEIVGSQEPPLAGRTERRATGAAPHSAAQVTPETSVKVLAERLLLDNLRTLYVVDADDCVIGVVGRRDLLQQILPPHPSGLALLLDALPGVRQGELATRIEQAHALTAAEVMVSPVCAITPDATVTAVVRLMLDRGLHEVPVLDHGRLVGVVTQQDILRQQLAGQQNEEGADSPTP